MSGNNNGFNGNGNVFVFDRVRHTINQNLTQIIFAFGTNQPTNELQLLLLVCSVTQIAGLFLKIRPFTLMKIRPKLYKICQSWFKFLPNIKWTLEKLPTTLKIFDKVSKFRQIWSHCLCATMWSKLVTILKLQWSFDWVSTLIASIYYHLLIFSLTFGCCIQALFSKNLNRNRHRNVHLIATNLDTIVKSYSQQVPRCGFSSTLPR